ncbi:hypothetical protein Taro_055712 [Colocasia esculenta]|uniref:Secreted protein n=1 Tax=Colocasia esculenta TaxID=4460 RepID=A0A843XTQ9_COLES|nr:hypothetical protein [Colocasia esculenta]
MQWCVPLCFHGLVCGIPCEASAHSREMDSGQARYWFNGLGRGVPSQLVSKQAVVMADRRDWGGGGDDPEESTQRMIERIWDLGEPHRNPNEDGSAGTGTTSDRRGGTCGPSSTTARGGGTFCGTNTTITTRDCGRRASGAS